MIRFVPLTVEFCVGPFTLKREGSRIVIRKDGDLVHATRGWTAALLWLDDRPGAAPPSLFKAPLSAFKEDGE